MRQKLKDLLLVIIILLALIAMCSSCIKPPTCPTYNNAYRSKVQLKQEKRGGEMGACAYVEEITKKERKRSNRIWNSKFCEVPKNKKSKF